MSGLLITPNSARALRQVIARDRRQLTMAPVASTASPIMHWWKVVDNTPIPGESYRWWYTLEDPDDPSIVVEKAINKEEDANTATHVAPGVVVAGLPAGFDVHPFGQCRDGTKLEIPVLASYRGLDDDDLPIWWFGKENPIDGVCP